MQILSISLHNIKSHQDRELFFVKGINVLAGANGVGKSTIFEAIGYALFGVDARDFVGNILRFITIGAKRGEVSVTFATDDGTIYRSSRSVGAGSKWLLAKEIGGAFEVEDHAGAAETEARIKELLGLDSTRPLADQFKLVIGPFQNEFLGPFVIKQPARRQEAFDEILGIDAWRKAYKGTSTLLSTVKNKIEVMNVDIEVRQEHITALPEIKKQLTACGKEKAALEKKVKAQENNLAATEKLLVKLDNKEKMTESVKADIQIFADRVRVGEGKIGDQKERVKEAETAQKAQEESKNGKDAFVASEVKLKSLRAQEKERRLIEKDINTLDKENSRISQNLAHELCEIDKIKAQIIEEEQRLAKEKKDLIGDDSFAKTTARLPELTKEAEKLRAAQGLLDGRRAGLLEGQEKLAAGVCPFFKEQCQNISGKAPRDVFSARVEGLSQESIDLGKHLAKLDKEIRAAEKARQLLALLAVKRQENSKQLNAVAKRRGDNNKRQASLAGIRKQQLAAEKKVLARQEDLQKFKTIDSAIAREEKLRGEHQAARDIFFANVKDGEDLQNRRESLKKMLQLFEEIKQVLATKQKELAALEKDYDPKRHAGLRLAKEELLAAVATLKQKINDLGKDYRRLETEIKKMQAIEVEIKQRLAAKKKISDKEQLLKFLRNKIFNNVSGQLSERFREEISLRADIIYRNISESDEELSWGDKYQIILRDMQDGVVRERTDEQLSGGQTMSAVVSLRLALLQAIGARVAFFDEPTSNLDAARRANLAHAFRAIDVGREEVSEHWYDQLFLISHDVAFSEVTDQVIAL